MKKSLEAELMSIAHRILQLKNKADVHELKAVTGVLYEKLSVLSFAEKHFSGPQPSIGLKKIEKALESKPEIKEEKKNEARPDGTEHNTEAITEPNTEKIKNIVAEMPLEAEENSEKEEALKEILPSEEARKNELRDLGVHFDELPQFEPVAKPEKKQTTPKREDKTPTSEEFKPEQADIFENGMPEFERKEKPKTANDRGDQKKSLNDRLKKGITIGLNDRLAYIKHLFDGNASDYNRVLSQLNTFENLEEAKRFLQQQIKPDYNNWENKEVYEERFMAAIENKFD